MSSLTDALDIAKKAFLLTDQLDRLTRDADRLARTVEDHEGRLIRIETTLEIAQRTAQHKILPGS
jgi:hypothetical protein